MRTERRRREKGDGREGYGSEGDKKEGDGSESNKGIMSESDKSAR